MIPSHAVTHLASCWRASSRSQGHPRSQQGRSGDEPIRQSQYRGHPYWSESGEQEVVRQRFATTGFATSHSEAVYGERECGLTPVLAMKRW
jgi:hypothetical protein